MATGEQEIFYQYRAGPGLEKDRLIKAGWSSFIHGLVKKGVEAAKKTEGAGIYGEHSVSVIGFVFKRRNNQTVIKTLYLLERYGGCFCFTVSQREVDRGYFFKSRDVIGWEADWNEDKQEWKGKEMEFPILEKEAFDNFLTKGRKRKGYLPSETIWQSFFKGWEEKTLGERIEILRKVKKFCQIVSPAVYEAKCAEFFSRIK